MLDPYEPQRVACRNGIVNGLAGVECAVGLLLEDKRQIHYLTGIGDGGGCDPPAHRGGP
jgi:hypothetical protein